MCSLLQLCPLAGVAFVFGREHDGIPPNAEMLLDEAGWQQTQRRFRLALVVWARLPQFPWSLMARRSAAPLKETRLEVHAIFEVGWTGKPQRVPCGGACVV